MTGTKIRLALVPHPSRPGIGPLPLNSDWVPYKLQTVGQDVEEQGQVLEKWPG